METVGDIVGLLLGAFALFPLIAVVFLVFDGNRLILQVAVLGALVLFLALMLKKAVGW